MTSIEKEMSIVFLTSTIIIDIGNIISRTDFSIKKEFPYCNPIIMGNYDSKVYVISHIVLLILAVILLFIIW